MDVSNVKAGKKKIHARSAEEKCLTRIPTNLRELLQTGLLEGMDVTYKRRKTIDGEDLRGIIRGCLIQCFCKDCKGEEDARRTPSDFEKHAGSGNNRPAKYIYVDDRIPLSKVLDACKTVKIPTMLAQKIKQVIGKCQDDSPCSSTTTAKTCIENVYGVHQQTDTEMNDTTERSSNIDPDNTKLAMTVLEKHKSYWESLDDGTELFYYNKDKKMLDGVKKGKSISCKCCNKLHTPTLFEGHAGFPGRRNPYKNIYTSEHNTLHDLSLETKTDENVSTYQTGANDACTSSNMFKEETSNASIIDAVEPADDSLKYSDTPCCVCRGKHFSDAPFNLDTVLFCDQCEREYHVRCLKKKPKSLPEPEELWFCGRKCRGVHSVLQKNVEDGLKDLPKPILNILQKRQQQQQSVVDSGSDNNFNLKWCLLHGSTAGEEHEKCLRSVIALLHENFAPMSFGKISDLIPVLVHGETIDDMNYNGMYCALLFHKSKVASAVILRIFGRKLAEIPLVATRKKYHGRGYCKALIGCVEDLLASMRVKEVILPAKEGKEIFWKDKLDFEDLDDTQLEEYKTYYPVLPFKHSKVLHKPMKQRRSEIRQMEES